MTDEEKGDDDDLVAPLSKFIHEEFESSFLSDTERKTGGPTVEQFKAMSETIRTFIQKSRSGENERATVLMLRNHWDELIRPYERYRESDPAKFEAKLMGLKVEVFDTAQQQEDRAWELQILGKKSIVVR